MSTDFREQAPDNLRPYMQGRSDQFGIDVLIAAACAVAVALWLVFGE